jgi:hypothetical protein
MVRQACSSLHLKANSQQIYSGVRITKHESYNPIAAMRDSGGAPLGSCHSNNVATDKLISTPNSLPKMLRATGLTSTNIPPNLTKSPFRSEVMTTATIPLSSFHPLSTLATSSMDDCMFLLPLASISSADGACPYLANVPRPILNETPDEWHSSEDARSRSRTSQT